MYFEWKEVLFLIAFVLTLFSFVIPDVLKALKGFIAKKFKSGK
jgi:hypothetical protein